MAELGAAAIGAGATIGAALYTAASGFIARHENTHSLQVTEMRRHIADFEATYARGEVAEDDWRAYLAFRNQARTSESDYEESIETYKRTPMYNFVIKWKKRGQVRKRKKALRAANKSLRSHYYESTSDASDASSTTAASGSPPESRGSPAHSDEDNERILSWAEGVSNSKLDPNEDDELHLVAMDSQQQRCSLRDDLLPQRVGSNASPLDSRSVASVSPVFDLHRPSTSGDNLSQPLSESPMSTLDNISFTRPLKLKPDEQERLAHLDSLKVFLATAPARWDSVLPTAGAGASGGASSELFTFLDASPRHTVPRSMLMQFHLPNQESITCVIWKGCYYITGTDIVRALVFRFEAFGHPVCNMKKFEIGVLSDLRKLKHGVGARMEESKSPLLNFLFKHQCVRTQKKQKVFYWFSVPHDRLFFDALERDLKCEKMGIDPVTQVTGEPASSFMYDPKRGLYEQFGGEDDYESNPEDTFPESRPLTSCHS